MTTPCPQRGPGHVERDNFGLPFCCQSGGMYSYRNPATDPMCAPIAGAPVTPPRPPPVGFRDMLPRIMSDVTQADGRPGFALNVDSKGGRWACPDLFATSGLPPNDYGTCVQLLKRDSPIAPVVAPDPRFLGKDYVNPNYLN